MLKNYVTVALRSLRRHRVYSIINVTGLALGLACCLLILLYVQDERSYDRYHKHAGRIYRVALEFPSGDRHARTPHPLAPALVSDFPEVEAAVRFRRFDAAVRHVDQLFKEDAFYYADASVFDVFTFPLLAGDPATALVEPYSLVLTEEAARKYFGADDPLGRVLTVEGLGALTVTGVAQTIPSHSHFTFDGLASYATRYALQDAQLEAWDNFVTSTYLLVRDGYDRAPLDARLQTLAAAHLSGDDAAIRFYLDPLPDLHLYAHTSGDLGTGGDARQLYLFSSIALFILLIACINFMSLATARSAERAREVGVRKVLGAARRQLIRQFMGEAILLVGLALVLALMLVELALPAFNTLLGKTVRLSYGAGLGVMVLGVGLGVSVLAGSYPAFALSAFRPVHALKGQPPPNTTGFLLRKGLVVAQFGLSTALIIGTLLVAEQLAYLQHKDLGFDKEQVVVIQLQDDAARAQYAALKDALQAHPSVLGVAASYHTPGRGLGQYYVEVEDVDGVLDLSTYIIDHDYLPMMEMEVVAGRAFSEAFATDATNAFMVNEAAVRRFGWEEPLGKTITWDGAKQGPVIGVVKDFHYRSLYETVEPLVLQVDPDYFSRLSVRIQPQDVPATLAFLQTTYQQFDPNHPFAYSFLDEDFAQHYVAAQRTGRLVRYASLLAVFIACLGLLGLASFTAQRRMKEIGVRKVLGASAAGIMLLLSRDFARLVLLGIVVACPLAYYAVRQWLADFAYRIEISWTIFLMAGLIALLVAVLTVSYQAIKAALTDPVKVLRHE